MVDFGGHMRFSFNGAPMVVRADRIEITGSNIDIKGITNEDGSVATVAKPSARKVSVDFQDSNPSTGGPFDWDLFMLGGPYNITLVEENTGIQHQGTGAKPVGMPKRSRSDGKVTGVEFLIPRGGYHQAET